jgi:DNA-binding NtrC family response regulator
MLYIQNNEFYSSLFDIADYSLENVDSKVLVVEDDDEWQLIIDSALQKTGANIQPYYVKSVKDAQRMLKFGPKINYIIADNKLDGDETGLDLWEKCQDQYKDVPFMMITGQDPRDLLDVANSEKSFPLLLKNKVDYSGLRAKIANFVLPNEKLQAAESM